MANDMSNVFGVMVKNAEGMLSWNAMALSQAEQFWKMREAILKDSEAFSKAWYKRRHEATKSAMKATKDMLSSKDPVAAVHLIAVWQRHSVERMSDDVQQFNELTANCASRILNAEKALEAAERETVAKGTGVAGKTRHATPV